VNRNLRKTFRVTVLAALLTGCARQQTVHEVKVEPARLPYHFPLVSPGAMFGELPSAVQNTIRAQAGSAEVSGVLKETNHDDAVYQILFRRETYPPLFVARDGAVLNPDYTVAIAAPRESRSLSVKTNELPPEVTKAWHERYPDVEVANIEREIWGNRTVYVFSFRHDKEHPKLYLRSDGVILDDTQK